MGNPITSPQSEWLRAWLTRHQFASLATPLVALAQNTIHLIPEPRGETSVGGSRLAGLPDVPPGFTWPRGRRDEHMAFIAQVNLAETAAYDSNQMLPPSGMLYFFLGEDEPAFDIACSVIYHPSGDSTHLAPFVAPDGWEWRYAGDLDDLRELPRSVRFAQGISLPGFSQIADQLREQEVDESEIDRFWEAFMTISDELQSPEAIHLLGYSIDAQEISAEEAQQHRPHTAVTDWHLLLEVASNFSIPFNWWDAGYLHFFITREDLSRQHFDQVYAGIESS